MNRYGMGFITALAMLCACSSDSVSPADQALQIDFWLSRTSLGTSESVFHMGDTIYFNCTLRNLTGDSLGWGMGDGGRE
jgi:hypothetical protein